MSTTFAPTALLTLNIPASLEEEVSDFLLLHSRWAPGFSMVEAQGAGDGASLMSAMEQVRGRCQRLLVMVPGQPAEFSELLSRLAQQIRHPDVRYWITPLLAAGGLL